MNTDPNFEQQNLAPANYLFDLDNVEGATNRNNAIDYFVKEVLDDESAVDEFIEIIDEISSYQHASKDKNDPDSEPLDLYIENDRLKSERRQQAIISCCQITKQIFENPASLSNESIEKLRSAIARGINSFNIVSLIGDAEIQLFVIDILPPEQLDNLLTMDNCNYFFGFESPDSSLYWGVDQELSTRVRQKFLDSLIIFTGNAIAKDPSILLKDPNSDDESRLIKDITARLEWQAKAETGMPVEIFNEVEIVNIKRNLQTAKKVSEQIEELREPSRLNRRKNKERDNLQIQIDDLAVQCSTSLRNILNSSNVGQINQAVRTLSRGKGHFSYNDLTSILNDIGENMFAITYTKDDLDAVVLLSEKLGRGDIAAKARLRLHNEFTTTFPSSMTPTGIPTSQLQQQQSIQPQVEQPKTPEQKRNRVTQAVRNITRLTYSHSQDQERAKTFASELKDVFGVSGVATDSAAINKSINIWQNKDGTVELETPRLYTEMTTGIPENQYPVIVAPIVDFEAVRDLDQQDNKVKNVEVKNLRAARFSAEGQLESFDSMGLPAIHISEQVHIPKTDSNVALRTELGSNGRVKKITCLNDQGFKIQITETDGEILINQPFPSGVMSIEFDDEGLIIGLNQNQVAYIPGQDYFSQTEVANDQGGTYKYDLNNGQITKIEDINTQIDNEPVITAIELNEAETYQPISQEQFDDIINAITPETPWTPSEGNELYYHSGKAENLYLKVKQIELVNDGHQYKLEVEGDIKGYNTRYYTINRLQEIMGSLVTREQSVEYEEPANQPDVLSEEPKVEAYIPLDKSIIDSLSERLKAGLLINLSEEEQFYYPSQAQVSKHYLNEDGYIPYIDKLAGISSEYARVVALQEKTTTPAGVILTFEDGRKVMDYRLNYDDARKPNPDFQGQYVPYEAVDLSPEEANARALFIAKGFKPSGIRGEKPQLIVSPDLIDALQNANGQSPVKILWWDPRESSYLEFLVTEARAVTNKNDKTGYQFSDIALNQVRYTQNEDINDSTLRQLENVLTSPRVLYKVVTEDFQAVEQNKILTPESINQEEFISVDFSTLNPSDETPVSLYLNRSVDGKPIQVVPTFTLLNLERNPEGSITSLSVKAHDKESVTVFTDPDQITKFTALNFLIKKPEESNLNSETLEGNGEIVANEVNTTDEYIPIDESTMNAVLEDIASRGGWVLGQSEGELFALYDEGALSPVEAITFVEGLGRYLVTFKGGEIIDTQLIDPGNLKSLIKVLNPNFNSQLQNAGQENNPESQLETASVQVQVEATTEKIKQEISDADLPGDNGTNMLTKIPKVVERLTPEGLDEILAAEDDNPQAISVDTLLDSFIQDLLVSPEGVLKNTENLVNLLSYEEGLRKILDLFLESKKIGERPNAEVAMSKVWSSVRYKIIESASTNSNYMPIIAEYALNNKNSQSELLSLIPKTAEAQEYFKSKFTDRNQPISERQIILEEFINRIDPTDRKVKIDMIEKEVIGTLLNGPNWEEDLKELLEQFTDKLVEVNRALIVIAAANAGSSYFLNEIYKFIDITTQFKGPFRFDIIQNLDLIESKREEITNAIKTHLRNIVAKDVDADKVYLIEVLSKIIPITDMKEFLTPEYISSLENKKQQSLVRQFVHGDNINYELVGIMLKDANASLTLTILNTIKNDNPLRFRDRLFVPLTRYLSKNISYQSFLGFKDDDKGYVEYLEGGKLEEIRALNPALANALENTELKRAKENISSANPSVET